MDEPKAAPEWRISQWFNTTEPLTIETLRGRAIVACAFQMLCPGCVDKAIPQMKAVHELFGKQNVTVVGLHTVFEHHEAMTPTSLKAFIHEYRITFPVGVDASGDDSHPAPQTMRLYQMRGTPTIFLIDKKGLLQGQIFGHISDLQLGAEIMALIKED